MFKPSSGRKLESGVWEHFVFEAAIDKSRCCVRTGDKNDTENHECGTLLNGENATNLYKHSLSASSQFVGTCVQESETD